jgi:hypothetical protein
MARCRGTKAGTARRELRARERPQKSRKRPRRLSWSIRSLSSYLLTKAACQSPAHPHRVSTRHHHTTEKRAHNQPGDACDARDFFALATPALASLSVCGIAGIVHVRIAPASATLYGNRAHRATASNYSGGRSVERERESEPTSRSTSSTPRSVHPKFSHTLTRHGPPPGSTCPAHAT